MFTSCSMLRFTAPCFCASRESNVALRRGRESRVGASASAPQTAEECTELHKVLKVDQAVDLTEELRGQRGPKVEARHAETSLKAVLVEAIRSRCVCLHEGRLCGDNELMERHILLKG